MTAEVLAAAKNLKVVARAGVGVDNIDVDAATQHGVVVVNSPSGYFNLFIPQTKGISWDSQQIE